MTGRVFRPFAWGTLTTDSTMFVSHPPSWKIMPFASQPQHNWNKFQELIGSYWILWCDMVISTFPHFFGAQKLGMREKGGQLGGGVCTQTPSLGRMALDGFGTFLTEDVMLHMHAHTWDMDLHGSTWMYMETFQTSCSGTGRRWCQTWEHDMQLARAKTSLLNQKPDVAILWEILRSDDLTNEAKYTFLFQSFNFFFRIHANVSSKTRSDGSLSLHAKAREGRGCCGSLSFFYLRQRKNSMETANERG